MPKSKIETPEMMTGRLTFSIHPAKKKRLKDLAWLNRVPDSELMRLGVEAILADPEKFGLKVEVDGTKHDESL